MKIPKNLRIGHRTYNLEFKDIVRGEVNEPCWGTCDKNYGIITIRSNIEEQMFKDTLLHEILHGVWNEYNLQEGDDEERTVSTMATGLTQVFLDNPKIGKLLCSKP